MPVVGQVVALWRYPLKSMQGQKLDSGDIGPDGFWGDRGWALRYADGRKNVSAKQVAGLMLCEANYSAEPSERVNPPVKVRLPDGKELLSDSAEAAAALSEFAGAPVILDATPGAHFDAHPVHLLTTASLETLSRLAPGSNFDARRFRPNIVVKAAGEVQEGFVELGWCGSDIRIGEAELLIKKPCRRCVMTTHPQADLPQDPAVLKTLVDAAEANLGVYAAVLKAGRVRVGDTVTLL
jgi:uncharacterized protein YcbX